MPHCSVLQSWLLAVAAAIAAPAAFALDVRCVSTVSQFNAALVALEDDDVEIRLVTGTYDVSNTCAGDAPNCEAHVRALTIRGGYATGCGSRSLDPGSTVITAPNANFFSFPLDSSLNTDASLFLQRLTIRSVQDTTQIVDRITLESVWYDQAGIVFLSARDQLTVRNSLFTRSGAGDVNPPGITFAGDGALIEHNTFADNARAVTMSSLDSGTVRNNIFWNNAGGNLRFQLFDSDDPPMEISVRNNLWSSVSGLSTLANPPTSTLTFDPEFVNPAALNYRLQANSPAISTAFPASTLLAQIDFTGGPRWFGEAPDRGAFESSIGSTAPLITVTSTNDSGAGSLRQAIIDANALPNVNRIEFDIGTTCGPRNIALSTPLPTITNPVVIDGYTQPGAQRNTLTTGSNAIRCIAITGGGTVINAIATGSADNVSVTLDGLGFGGFSLNAVNLTGGNGHRFIGSQIGGVIGPAGTPLTLAPSVNGLVVGALLGSGAAAGVEIGGESPAERNVISDVTDAAIRLGAGAEGARVTNSYIGVGPNGGLSSESNRDGIVIAGRNNEVRGNVVSNNTRHGVLVTGADALANRIVDNRIGIEAFCNFGICSTTLGNTEDGVRFEFNASRNLVERNVIQSNGGDGVVVATGTLNAIVRNTLVDNAEQPVDLGDNGTSADGNNTVPPAGAANLGQNRPVLSSAGGPIAAGVATGTLTSANGLYRIDYYSAVNCPTFFVPPVASGEPETWLGTSYATISNGTATTDGSVTFSGLIGVAGDTGFFNQTRRIAATATRMGSTVSSVPRSTSEVSSCVIYAVELFKDGFE